MDEMILRGDINGKANCGGNKDPSSSTVTAHRMTTQFVRVICASVHVCLSV